MELKTSSIEEQLGAVYKTRNKRESKNAQIKTCNAAGPRLVSPLILVPSLRAMLDQNQAAAKRKKKIYGS